MHLIKISNYTPYYDLPRKAPHGPKNDLLGAEKKVNRPI